MDRRRFLAAGGIAASSPLWMGWSLAAGGDTPGGPGTGDGSTPVMFNRVDFTSDGLGLDPREYTTLLREVAMAGSVEADSYSRGGAVERIEHAFARLLGKQAAMFLPTGTLANHLAVRTLAGSDRRVLVQADSHLYNDSGDGTATLSGLNLVPLALGRGSSGLDEVRHWVERSASGRVRTPIGAISIENPIRRKNHEMVDFDELQRICGYAREHGIRLHLDGARMFNLPQHSGRGVRDHAALFDTVFVSLWKHFNASSGAILAGDSAFIDGLFHVRRMFGGALPQAWPEVALVLQHVEGYEARYARSWQAAEQLLALLESHGGFKSQRVAHGTSMFLLEVSGAAPEAIRARALERHVVLPRAIPGTGMFPLQVNPTLLRMQPALLAQVLIESARA